MRMQKNKEEVIHFSPRGHNALTGSIAKQNGLQAACGFKWIDYSVHFLFAKGFWKFWRCINIAKVGFMINEQIRDKEVRLVDEDGSMLGLMTGKEAQALADAKNLDLVKIAPKAEPPVCKIMDYGKFMFEQTKKDKEAKKNQKTINIKEIWMKPKIEEHDFGFKSKNTIKFLKEGNKVKVGVRFRGREMQHTSLGRDVLSKFAATLTEAGDIERQPYLEGRSMTMIVIPKKETTEGGKSGAQN